MVEDEIVGHSRGDCSWEVTHPVKAEVSWGTAKGSQTVPVPCTAHPTRRTGKSLIPVGVVGKQIHTQHILSPTYALHNYRRIGYICMHVHV